MFFTKGESAGGKFITEKSMTIPSAPVRLWDAAAIGIVVAFNGRRHMLKAIIRAIRRVLSVVGSAAGRALGALFGSREAPPLPSPEFETIVDEQVEELREGLEAAPDRPNDVLLSVGARIHAYAAGDREVRDTFDFDGIPEHVSVALLVMPPHQLCRLAAAGPAICGRWAAGEKTGLVGVPLPDTDWVPAIRPQAPDGDDGAHLPALVPAGERRAVVRPALAA